MGHLFALADVHGASVKIAEAVDSAAATSTTLPLSIPNQTLPKMAAAAVALHEFTTLERVNIHQEYRICALRRV
jgi:hypothetical protein